MPKVQYGTPLGAQQQPLSNEDIARLLMELQAARPAEYDPMGDILEQQPHPIYSVGQGFAELAGTLGKAYFDRKAREKQNAAVVEGNALLAQGMSDAANTGLRKPDPKTGMVLDAAHFAPLSGNARMVSTQLGVPDPGTPGPSLSWDLGPGMSPEDRGRYAFSQMAGRNAALANAAAPKLFEMAARTEPPSFTGSLAPGNRAFVRGQEVAVVPANPSANETPLSPEVEAQRIRIANASRVEPQEPLVQVPDPSDPTKAIYVPRSQAIGKQAFQTQRERMPRLQTYWAEDGSSRQLDSNDPDDQKIIKEQGLVSQSPTDTERTAKGFLDRMQNAERGIAQLLEQNPGFDPVNAKDVAASKMLPGSVGQSSLYQQFWQMAGDWYRAKLRKESGAVIGDQETKDEVATYFPVVGDKPEAIAKKRDSRMQAERQLATGAGILGRKRLRELETMETSTKAREAFASLDQDPELKALVDKWAPVNP